MRIGNVTLQNRLLLGTSLYKSLEAMILAIKSSGIEVVTTSLRRQTAQTTGPNAFFEAILETGCHVLPNTAGCKTVKEAVTTAEMAREIFKTNWIKLEIIGDEYNLQPNIFSLVEAAKELLKQDFIVLPYCTEDLTLCMRLVEIGCNILMPWGAPIGTGKGILNPYSLSLLRQRLPHTTLIIDAGIGAPSHAAYAMELGFDGILLNSAVALSNDAVQMAKAFDHAVKAGRLAYQAGLMVERNTAQPSTPLVDTLFWHREEDYEKNSNRLDNSRI